MDAANTPNISWSCNWQFAPDISEFPIEQQHGNNTVNNTIVQSWKPIRDSNVLPVPHPHVQILSIIKLKHKQAFN